MAGSFTIEIPIVVTDAGSSATVHKIEAELNRLTGYMARISGAGNAAFASLASGASSAAGALNGTNSAAMEAATAMEQIDSSADEAAESVEDIGDAMEQAGSEATSSMSNATSQIDQFSQRVEKSQKSIREMFREKMSLTLQAIDKVSPVLKSITASLKNVTRKAWNIAVKVADFVTAPFQKLAKMITSPLVMTLSIAGIGMGASSFVNTYKEFAAGMSNVKALSGATEAEFVKLNATAEELGATTKFTASEAAEGMQYLAMAGWDTNKIIAAMPGLLDLAAAGNTNLGTAADIVSDVMTAMGMSADQASRAADIFARTATSTNTTIENMGETLKYAAPAAHAFGLELSEVATLTGMMANAGVKGSMAGTALRTSLLQMASPTKSVQKAMDALNVTFADSTGNMKDMKTIVGDLSKAFSGLSEQEKLTYAEDLFGKQASSAWLSVIEQGTDEFNRLFEAINNSNGAAHEMAEIQLDNLAGDLTLLQSAVDGMKISVMKELAPTLRAGVQWVTSKIPQITDMLTNVAKTAIEKFGQVKDFLVGVFNSPDFKNADGFADKLFVAWDKIIAEPFAQWWEGGGKDTILNMVSKIGKSIGEVYHGVISGIFAALKGEEINFEGMNLTGLAKAGADAAKTFINNFKESFDLSGLVGEMPGLLKAALLGFGALKVGGGIIGMLSTAAKLKLVFTGIPIAAGSAGTAIGSVGAKAAASTGLITKLGAGIKTVGAALANVPVWGWAAAAAIAALVIGIDAYNRAQAEHEQALLNTGKAAREYEKEYIAAAMNVENAMDSMQMIKTIQIRLAENKGGNKAVIAEVQAELDGLLDKTVTLTVNMARSATPEEAAQYQAELEAELHDYTATITAKLVKDGYDEETVATIIEQYNGIQSNTKEITLIIASKTDLTAQEIQTYVHNLNELMKTKAEKELLIEGNGLAKNPAKITELKTRLDEIKSRKAKIEIEMEAGNNLHAKEYQQLLQEEGVIKTKLEGADMSVDEINKVKTSLAQLQGEAEGILLKIGYDPNSDLQQEDIDKIAQLLADMAGQHYTASIALKNNGMSKDEINELIDAQNKLYRNMIETSGGVFTQRDVEQGRITQEDYDWWVKDQATKAEIAKKKFDTQVTKDRENIGELVEKRDAAKAEVEKYSGEYNAIKNDKKLVEDVRNKRDMIMASFEAGEIDYAGRDKQLGELISEAKGYDWSDAKNNPFADGMLPRGLAGEMMGGDPLDNYLSRLNKKSESVDQKYEAAKADVAKYQEPLNQQYQNEISKITLDQTSKLGIESGLTTKSIDELAASFGSLDEAGRKAFADTIEGIREFNESVDYIDEDKMVNVDELLNTAIKSGAEDTTKSAINDITSALEHLDSQYKQFGTDQSGNALIPEGHVEQAQKDLAAVNQILDGLNLDKISDLSQIGTAVEQINSIDPSALDLSDAGIKSVSSALSALGGNATKAQSKLKAAKGAAEALAGTYTVKVKYVTEGSLPSAPGNAYGGIYDGAFLSWVAEDGPEAIIPLGNDKRSRGIDLWLQAGRALGVSEFADGGLMAPYTGLFEALPDEATPDLPPAGNSGSSNQTIQVNAEVNPVFQIDGADSEDIIEKLKSKQKELAELFGGAIADQLEDIVTNMV